MPASDVSCIAVIGARQVTESLITDPGVDPIRTGTLARSGVGHREPKAERYGEEFHHDDAAAVVALLCRTVSAGTGRP